jgi:hypothetical protein
MSFFIKQKKIEKNLFEIKLFSLFFTAKTNRIGKNEQKIVINFEKCSIGKQFYTNVIATNKSCRFL